MTTKPTVENTILCTYFDKGYIIKGLALYESLIRHEPDINLWILAFDKFTQKVFAKMNLKGVTVVPIWEFEDKELLAVKKTRSTVEYMWTAMSSFPLYVFKKSRKAKYVMYLDADVYFFSSPVPILNEAAKGSMLAVEHRYPKGREALNEQDGRFNVAVNLFKRDEIAIRCLKRWRKQCLDWCYWRLEDGKMGDQMYLNEWPKLYGKHLVISENIGVNVAPWNVSQYKVTKRESKILINGSRLVCYHFHQFQIYGLYDFDRAYGYTLTKDVENIIYKPYEIEIREQYKRIKRISPSFKIKPVIRYSTQMARQKLAKYIGPFYWRFLTIINEAKSYFKNAK